MKKTKVQDGVVTCPKCGAQGSFTAKRSIKGKMALGIAAPKRLKCNGCGAYLKAS